MKKSDEYEYFEEKYEGAEYPTKHKSIFKTARSLPFVNTKVHMDVLSRIDTNTFARIDNAIYQEIENFPEYDYENSIAYEMLIRTNEYKQLHYDSSLTNDEKIEAYDRMGANFQEIYNYALKKSNFFSNQQSNAKNIFDSYCDLTIGDVREGINKLINFYVKRNQIYTLGKHDKDAFEITQNIQYEICQDINSIDITLSISNYYIPTKVPILAYGMYADRMTQIDNNIPLVILEEEFLAAIEPDIPNSIKTKVIFNSTRPLLRFKESPIVDIPVNLNLSKEAIVELISKLKDEFDSRHVRSSISYLYHKTFKAKNWKKDAPFKVTNKSIAQAFFVYDLYHDIDGAFQTKKSQLREVRENKIAETEAETAKKIEKEKEKLSVLIEKRKLANQKNTNKIIQQDKRDTKKKIRRLEKERDQEIQEIKNGYKEDSNNYDTDWVLANLVKKDNISPYMCKQYLIFMRQYIKNLQYKELIIGIEATA